MGDWLLLGLGGFIDFIDELKDPFGLLSNFYQQTYGFIPSRFQRTNIYHSIWRKLKIKEIKRTTVKGKARIALTSKGIKKIRRRFQILFRSKKRWDGFFRVVIYDISEESRRVRDNFRKKLKELGFGFLQKSVWLSPYDFLTDLKEFLKANKLDKKVLILETKYFYTGNLKEFAANIWPIDEINDGYKKIYKKLRQFKSLKNYDDRSKFLNNIKTKIINLYFKDPFLPKEFLPNSWAREKVFKLIKKLKIFS